MPLVVGMAVELHGHVTSHLMPTAANFHYLFNLRELAHVTRGLLLATPECARAGSDVVRLWVHESRRAYGDKASDERDSATFERLLAATVKRVYEVTSSNFSFFC